ncbi:MAG: rhodanese-like domain-containing protein [Desulfuromonadaceae bacterium]
MKTITRRIWFEAGIIFALGVVVGLSINIQLVLDAFSGRLTLESSHGVESPSPSRMNDQALEPALFPIPVLLADIRELQRTGALLVDARTAESYDEGHLPGALSLPLGELDDRLGPFVNEFPKETTLIIYCSGFGCPDSFDVGVRLLEAGYGDVRVYEGGFPEWRDAGLPVIKEAP